VDKLKDFMVAQAKAEQLRNELLGELRKEILDVHANMGISMNEVLGEEIVSLMGTGEKATRPVARRVSTKRSSAAPVKTCYLNPEVINVPAEIHARMKAISNLPINDLVPATGDPDHSEVDWLRKASPEQRDQMKVPNPKWWFHPSTKDSERESWKP